MGSIGTPELIVMALIAAVVLIPVVIVVVVLTKKRPPAMPPADLVQCRACRRPVSPRATACPQCGEPRA